MNRLARPWTFVAGECETTRFLPAIIASKPSLRSVVADAARGTGDDGKGASAWS
jgi:hypothetical protein